MIHLIKVWERTGEEHRTVGEMVCEIADNGRGKGAFRYDREFLERGDAFALDPVSLPLKPPSPKYSKDWRRAPSQAPTTAF